MCEYWVKTPKMEVRSCCCRFVGRACFLEGRRGTGVTSVNKVRSFPLRLAVETLSPSSSRVTSTESVRQLLPICVFEAEIPSWYVAGPSKHNVVTDVTYRGGIHYTHHEYALIIRIVYISSVIRALLCYRICGIGRIAASTTARRYSKPLATTVAFAS